MSRSSPASRPRRAYSKGVPFGQLVSSLRGRVSDSLGLMELILSLLHGSNIWATLEPKSPETRVLHAELHAVNEGEPYLTMSVQS